MTCCTGASHTTRPLATGNCSGVVARHLAALAAPYRHARLSATKPVGDPNNPVRMRDDGTAAVNQARLYIRIAQMTREKIFLNPPTGATSLRNKWLALLAGLALSACATATMPTGWTRADSRAVDPNSWKRTRRSVVTRSTKPRASPSPDI
jgi:hypothetical protein